LGTRIYVANLPFSCDEPQLRALFEQGGRAVKEVKLVHDRDTGRPRGFGFVEMANEGDAASAIAELHGTNFGGRMITVTEARERGPRR
jgi:RNA recognition motif-containing protein